jgi:hypothetical protein
MKLIADYYVELMSRLSPALQEAVIPTPETMEAAQIRERKEQLTNTGAKQKDHRQAQQRYRNKTMLPKTIYQIQQKQTKGDLLITKADTQGSNNAKGY